MDTHRGFIALMSVLIISVVLLVSVISLAQFGITNRFALLELERKSASKGYAIACIEMARIAIVNDPDFDLPSNPTKTVGDGECTFVTVDIVDSDTTRVAVRGVRDTSYTNLRAEINRDDGSLESLVEVGTLP